MDLASGSKLGPYEILAPVGSGGMGQVYRARDGRLGREVAIKLLPAEHLNETRRQRFRREARAASALNHPNIVTVHEIGLAEGRDFIVMEYVDGRGLDRVIPRGGLPVSDALRVAIPIADALAQAHQRGIVHRDLKPANVLVANEGTVKLADFGLAKPSGGDPTDGASETDSFDAEGGALSRPGRVSGTLGYMSPEQARGSELDARSDVFGFGILLYEMLTGRRPFAGESAADTITAVLNEEPAPPRALAPLLPLDLERLVLRCLRKEVSRRYQSMADVRLDLEQIKEDSDSRDQRAGAFRAPRRGPRRLFLALAAGFTLSTAAWWVWRHGGSASPVLQLVPLTTLHGWEWSPTFSPDGTQVAFSWDEAAMDGGDIYVSIVGSPERLRLTTDPAPDRAPSWSPDGRRIAFLRISPEGAGTIHLVSPLGGAAHRLSDFPTHSSGTLSWSPDGRWLAAVRRGDTDWGNDGVHLVPLAGGEPRRLSRPPPSGGDWSPAFAPDGRRLAWVACSGPLFLSHCGIRILDLDDEGLPVGTAREIATPGPDVRLVTWAHDGASLVCTVGGPHFSGLCRIDARGRRRPEPIGIAGPRAWGADVARSRNRLAFASSNADVDIERFEVGRPSTAAVSTSFPEVQPRISPDGRQIAFGGSGAQIWLAGADGSQPHPLTDGPGRSQGSAAWSPDGRMVAFDSRAEDDRYDVWAIDADGGTPRRLTAHAGDENVPSWSSDGRWVYFTSERSGRREIWRVPAAGGAEEQVTHGGAGYGARETADGRVLLFKRGIMDSALVALPLAEGPERTLVGCVRGSEMDGGFDVAGGAVYYADCRQPDPALHRLDTATGRDEVLGPLEKFGGSFTIAVSPDGGTVLFTKVTGEGSDLMLIEGFR